MLFRDVLADSPQAAQGRIAGRGPVGVIDIGSNSVRLVVYERLARSPTPLFNEKVLAGLGAGVAANGRLSDDAMQKTRQALRRFRTLLRQMQVQEIDIVATAAMREADNGPAFLAEVEAICETPVLVLSGPEEARIAALGIVAGFQAADGLAGDLGGGSLELTDVKGREIQRGESLKLGGLRLLAAAGGSLGKAREIVRRDLDGSSVIGRLKSRTFYAIGGTWRSIARLHMHVHNYPLHVMHEYRMDADELEVFLKGIINSPLENVPGVAIVSKQRQTLLSYGAVVLLEILRAGKPKAVEVSALGVREGLLYQKLSAAEQAEDPLLSAARELSVLRSRSPAHALELVPWTQQALQALGIEEKPAEGRLREGACLLADIGWRAHPDYRGEQSLNIISHAAFVGIDHPGRAYLALAVYYRHAGLSEDDLGSRLRDLVPARYRENARALAAAFRVAYLVSAAMGGVLPRTLIRRSDKTLELVLPEDLAGLAGPRLESRMKQFAALAGLAPAIVTS